MSEFGDELQRLMAARGVGVRALARQVPCNAGHISQLRHGQKRPSPQTAKRLDEVLDAGGRLVALAARLFPRRLGGSAAGMRELRNVPVPVDHAMRVRLSEFPPTQLDELICYLDDQWHSLVKADNLLGPRHALGAVHVQLGVIEALLRSVRPPARQLVLRLGAKYAESSAWLHEDSSDMAGARYWTGRSMEWAVEGGDRLMVSWTLFRRGQQAAADRDAAQVLGLAAAARREAEGCGGPMLAAIFQQEAQAHALDGSEVACHNSLDRAHGLAAAPDDPGDASNGHGSFCTAAYLEMQRGACWLTLGRPVKAIAALETAVGSLPPAYRRDRGAALGYQAAGFAAAGEPAEAATVAMQALDIARDSGSERIMRMVVATADVLAPHSELEAVAALQAALAETSAA